MTPPPLTDEFATRGVVTDDAPLAVYPTPVGRGRRARAESQYVAQPDRHGQRRGRRTLVSDRHWRLRARRRGVPARADRGLHRPLAGRQSDHAGARHRLRRRRRGRVFLAIRGTGTRPTPTGVFTILRRVANETMNSDTIGIPRFGPGGYYLTNVLFTQYFTGDGASLHYNYWSRQLGLPRQPRLPRPDLRRQRLALGLGPRRHAQSSSTTSRVVASDAFDDVGAERGRAR